MVSGCTLHYSKTVYVDLLQSAVQSSDKHRRRHLEGLMTLHCTSACIGQVCTGMMVRHLVSATQAAISARSPVLSMHQFV